MIDVTNNVAGRMNCGKQVIGHYQTSGKQGLPFGILAIIAQFAIVLPRRFAFPLPEVVRRMRIQLGLDPVLAAGKLVVLQAASVESQII